jgi:hypothetical protein
MCISPILNLSGPPTAEATNCQPPARAPHQKQRTLLRQTCRSEKSTHAVILTESITNPDGSITHVDAEDAVYDEARENLYALLEEATRPHPHR